MNARSLPVATIENTGNTHFVRIEVSFSQNAYVVRFRVWERIANGMERTDLMGSEMILIAKSPRFNAKTLATSACYAKQAGVEGMKEAYSKLVSRPAYVNLGFAPQWDQAPIKVAA